MSPPAPPPSRGLCPRPGGEMLASPAAHLALSIPAAHSCGVAFSDPLAEPPSAPFIPHKRVGVCASRAPGGGGCSWRLPLPSAVPGPEQSTQQVLSDAALNASWCPAPRGPHASASPSAVTPWAVGRQLPLLPQSPLCGSSFWSLSEELPVRENPLSSAPGKWRSFPHFPNRGPGRRFCLRDLHAGSPCRSQSGRRVSHWPCFLLSGKRLLRYPESPTLPCPHVGGGWSLRIPWR